MKQIVITSGKGGTGKTTVVAALSRLFENKYMVDCDVDASNLGIIIPHQVIHNEPFSDAEAAVIDPEKCTSCGNCTENCRFDAISDDFVVDESKCEGCYVCQVVCPANAVSMVKLDTGTVSISESPMGKLYHGSLSAGRDNSGKLVTYLRELAANEAQTKEIPYILIDGSPGIGCAVIASVSGTDFALMVTEPTPTAQHDLERVVDLVNHFKIPMGLVINKSDINKSLAGGIRLFAQKNGVPIMGEIPFDPEIPRLLSQGKSPMESERDALKKPFIDIYKAVIDTLG